MTACVICGRLCTQMADYDTPVCPRCDERMETILAVGPMPRTALTGADLFDRLRAQLAAA